MEERELLFWTAANGNGRPRESAESGADTSSLYVAAREAASWGDYRMAVSFAERALGQDDSDPELAALFQWCRGLTVSDPTQEIEAIRRIVEATPDAIAPRAWLVHLLVRAHAVDEASRVESGFPSASMEDPLVQRTHATLLLSQGEPAQALYVLRALRSSWPRRSFGALTAELMAATRARDRQSFEEAYLERCRLEGRRPLPVASYLWNGSWAVILGIVLLWVAGVGLRSWWLQGMAFAFMAFLAFLSWDVFRMKRQLLPWAGFVFLLLALSVIAAFVR